MAGLHGSCIETARDRGRQSFTQAMATVPSVLLDTRFGQILALQCLALSQRLYNGKPWTEGTDRRGVLTGIACLPKRGTATPLPCHLG